MARVIHERERAPADGPSSPWTAAPTPESPAEAELFGWERGRGARHRGSREGLLSRAAGGTLFLDEVTALPGPVQSRLLRALREGQAQPLGGSRSYPVTARVIAAARAPLESEVRAGRLRQDLAASLGETRVTVPPLRERREDIMVLARRFAEETAMERGPSAAGHLRGRLAAPPRPRLARQRARAARRDPPRRGAQRGRGGARSPLAPRAPRGGGRAALRPPGGLSLRELAELGAAEAEQQAIREALRASRGNKSAAARLLKTDYKTLHAKMRQYAIAADEYRPA